MTDDCGKAVGHVRHESLRPKVQHEPEHDGGNENCGSCLAEIVLHLIPYIDGYRAAVRRLILGQLNQQGVLGAVILSMDMYDKRHQDCHAQADDIEGVGHYQSPVRKKHFRK